MFCWKRKIGAKLIIGDEIVILVKAVTPTNGEKFRGEVTLGFEVPKGVLVQRAETYLKQQQTQPFPAFYRVLDKENGRIYGYSFNLPAEGSTLSYGFEHELISDYADMIDDDHKIEIYFFRSEAEAEACTLGVAATGEIGVNLGVVKGRVGYLWAVLFDKYEETIDDINPVIRSFAISSPKVMNALHNEPGRKTG